MTKRNPSRIVIASNTAWNIVNFRGALIRALIKAGYDVVAVSPVDKYAERIGEFGARFVPLSIDNMGTHPLKDLLLFSRLLVILIRERPAAFLGYTVKPNVYGGLAARLLGIPAINNVAGLGTAFIRENMITRVVEVLYRLGFAKASKVFFQNADDRILFVSRGLVQKEVTEILPGSGVDTARFIPSALANPGSRPFRFLLLGRLLWDKGIGEYVQAARCIRAKRRDVEFQILGFLDVPNRTAISRTQMYTWEHEGAIRYLGDTDDVQPFIAQADCIVLPSYREGTPRALLEAASMGKPVVTTDSAGCRDVVKDGVSGYLCRPHDAADLAEKMEKILSLSLDQRIDMGSEGRNKILTQFDERIVITKYLDTLKLMITNDSLTGCSSSGNA
ncbi:MAG: glycosyltransferase family 4 protein [Proteobacteria bacterium]|nr:glycosyltransferase family 4 protein [Pseudomonadota bacterium]